jgi:hypothetical protein
MDTLLLPELLRVAIIGTLTAGFVCAPQPMVSPTLPRITQQRRPSSGGGEPSRLGGWLNPCFA